MAIFPHYGFVRIAAAVPKVKVADVEFNVGETITMAREADRQGAHAAVFPELGLTAYTCGDLFLTLPLQRAALEGLARFCKETKRTRAVYVVGLPIAHEGKLFNCAAICHHGKVLGVVPKTHLPNYKEFYEERWFAPARLATTKYVSFFGGEIPFGTDIVFAAESRPEFTLGVEICEDLWAPFPPSSFAAVFGNAAVLLNLSASNALIAKAEYRKSLVANQSATCIAAYAYAGAGPGESTDDVVYDGHAMIAENGAMLAESRRFAWDGELIMTDVDLERLLTDRQRQTSWRDAGAEFPPRAYRRIPFWAREHYDEPLRLMREVSAYPFVPQTDDARDAVCGEIVRALVAACRKRHEAAGAKKAIVGISGGADSTLALLVLHELFREAGWDKKDIIAVSMPGFGTGSRTRRNAANLAKTLGVTFMEVDIKPIAETILRGIGHDAVTEDTAYQNAQARVRMAGIEMNLANMVRGLVYGTGNLTELAAGWCTYGGDHASGYNPLVDVPKTLVYYVLGWFAEKKLQGEARETVNDIRATGASPELTKSDAQGRIQSTEAYIGPRDLWDFYLYHFLRWGNGPAKIKFLAEHAFAGAYTPQEILRWLRVFFERFFANQFKRSFLPNGPKIGSVSLSPRGDWRMPTDAEVSVWLKELDGLEKE